MELNGTLEPTSEDELTLMGEVEVLEMKLTAAGHPPNELVKKRFELRINAQTAQPLAVRVKSWNDRKAHLQLLVQSYRSRISWIQDCDIMYDIIVDFI